MKQLMTRERVFEIWYALKSGILDNIKLDKRFDYARNRTLENLDPEVSEIMKARKSGLPKYEEFESKREAIISLNCLKDSDGKYMTSNNKYVFETDTKERDATNQLIKLSEEYKDVLIERQKEVDIYNEIIHEEIEVDIVKTTFKSFPDVVNSNFTRVLKPMIKESDEEIEQLILG